MNRTLTAAALLALASAAPAFAVNYPMNWLDLSPTAFGGTPVNGGTYNLPGVGGVTMSYTNPIGFSAARTTFAPFSTGSVTNGPDTYSWTGYEAFGRTNFQADPPLNQQWSVTYTFPALIPAGSIILEVSGLGRRDDPLTGQPGAVSTAIVNQSGTFLGDFAGSPVQNFGATLFSGGIGSFQMENSVTGAGGIDPWWNTKMGLVRIDDAITSLTVLFNHTSGDGIGLNIAYINPVPAPAAAAVLGMGGMVLTRRRR